MADAQVLHYYKVTTAAPKESLSQAPFVKKAVERHWDETVASRTVLLVASKLAQMILWYSLPS